MTELAAHDIAAANGHRPELDQPSSHKKRSSRLPYCIHRNPRFAPRGIGGNLTQGQTVESHRPSADEVIRRGVKDGSLAHCVWTTPGATSDNELVIPRPLVRGVGFSMVARLAAFNSDPGVRGQMRRPTSYRPLSVGSAQRRTPILRSSCGLGNLTARSHRRSPAGTAERCPMRYQPWILRLKDLNSFKCRLGKQGKQ